MITDDGKGMDAEVLRNKAVEKGLLERDAADRLTDLECYNLIFARVSRPRPRFPTCPAAASAWTW